MIDAYVVFSVAAVVAALGGIFAFRMNRERAELQRHLDTLCQHVGELYGPAGSKPLSAQEAADTLTSLHRYFFSVLVRSLPEDDQKRLRKSNRVNEAMLGEFGYQLAGAKMHREAVNHLHHETAKLSNELADAQLALATAEATNEEHRQHDDRMKRVAIAYADQIHLLAEKLIPHLPKLSAVDLQAVQSAARPLPSRPFN
jgi:SMC interacting uncharacterized protein involved in chromosome segregation